MPTTAGPTETSLKHEFLSPAPLLSLSQTTSRRDKVAFMQELSTQRESQGDGILRGSRGKSMAKQVIIVGAGPGGLAAALLLAHAGLSVTILERQNYVGGRTSALRDQIGRAHV